METKKLPPKCQLKIALKTFKFWFKVLLDTEMMNDPNHRKKFAKAIAEVKVRCKKTKKES
jgi:hypothetical protein